MAKGIKSCPTCASETGARSLKCVKCGYEFKSAVIENGYCDPDKKPDGPRLFPIYGNMVYTPAGKCPAVYNGNLDVFLNKLEQFIRPNKLHPEAALYWLRSIGENNIEKEEVYAKLGVEYVA